MNSIDEIMNRLLEAIQANPEVSIDVAMKSVAAESGFSADDMQEIEECLKTLDKINIKTQELDEARRGGTTRDGWLKSELTDVAKFAGSNVEEVLSEIEKASEIGLNDSLTQEI